MYSLLNNLLGIPAQGANSTVSYISGALVLVLCVLIVDLFYRLIRSFFR